MRQFYYYFLLFSCIFWVHDWRVDTLDLTTAPNHLTFHLTQNANAKVCSLFSTHTEINPPQINFLQTFWHQVLVFSQHKMVKLTPELINSSMQYINPCRDRELDLRGKCVAIIFFRSGFWRLCWRGNKFHDTFYFIAFSQNASKNTHARAQDTKYRKSRIWVPH